MPIKIIPSPRKPQADRYLKRLPREEQRIQRRYRRLIVQHDLDYLYNV